jgi:hypothetical protein
MTLLPCRRRRECGFKEAGRLPVPVVGTKVFKIDGSRVLPKCFLLFRAKAHGSAFTVENPPGMFLGP